MNIKNELATLHEAIKLEAPYDAVKFELTITCDTVEYSVTRRTPESLGEAGIAMRNLVGHWITDRTKT